VLFDKTDCLGYWQIRNIIYLGATSFFYRQIPIGKNFISIPKNSISLSFLSNI